MRAFASIMTPDIADAMRGSGVMSREIAPLSLPRERVVGRAITVSLPFASQGILTAALGFAEPGDFMVVNAVGNMTTALVGGKMLAALAGRGAVGFVADGVVRDLSEIRTLDLCVCARGTATAEGPSGPEAGEVNVPVACGGAVVSPGDIVVCDEDGIVVVPHEAATAVLEEVPKLRARHTAMWPEREGGQREIAADPDLEQQLRAAGCEFA
jgi:regulator of RNase E activity RraA